MLVIGTDYGHNDTSSEILALRKLREDGACRLVVNKILTTTPGRSTDCEEESRSRFMFKVQFQSQRSRVQFRFNLEEP
jgi:hypothetical protein